MVCLSAGAVNCLCASTLTFCRVCLPSPCRGGEQCSCNRICSGEPLADALTIQVKKMAKAFLKATASCLVSAACPTVLVLSGHGTRSENYLQGDSCTCWIGSARWDVPQWEAAGLSLWVVSSVLVPSASLLMQWVKPGWPRPLPAPAALFSLCNPFLLTKCSAVTFPCTCLFEDSQKRAKGRREEVL